MLTEHVNASSVLAEFPLRADRARRMDELTPVLATPGAVVVAVGLYVVATPYVAGAIGSKQPS
ncbi:hypothetical protein [Streptomyces iakyrus]|uniref:hypothetical protein n=1 Tax=Streptomyces iakyrus TaxID=68219 RepID=UPI000525E9C5|nr:hypothetical protein [Streptomyces iakyrus]